MIKVIIKIESGSDLPIIFLPNTSSTSGTIAYCHLGGGGHNEASYDYYHKCKHASKAIAEKWREWYYNLGEDKTPVKLAYKQSAKDRTEAWGN